MRRSAAMLLVLILAAAGAGCQPSARRVDVTMQPTTEPAAPAERHVRLLVREQTAAGLTQTLVGRKCRVQLRRDALGQGGNTPDTLNSRWAHQASLDGTIVEMTDAWLVLDASNGRVAIPQNSILIVELKP